MAVLPINQPGTAIDTSQQKAAQKLLETERKKTDEENRRNCVNKGGVWNEATKTCSFPFKDQKPDPARIKVPEETPVDLSPKKVDRTQPLPKGAQVITDAQGNERIQTPEDIAQARQDIERNLGRQRSGALTTQQEEAQMLQQQQGQQLVGQVGQFGQLGVSPTGLDYGEAATAGFVSNIARAATVATGVALYTGAGTNPVSWGATAAAFVGTLVGGMISNMASQRRDTTTAQQRVLDEGKQTMKDWATLAQADPSNKARYLAEYNKQSAQIDQAYRQMKLDTSRDVAKFETALPNLAEFEAFYSAGGERDTLNVEMRNSLTAVSSEGYDMMELYNRRGTNE